MRVHQVIEVEPQTLRWLIAASLRRLHPGLLLSNPLLGVVALAVLLSAGVTLSAWISGTASGSALTLTLMVAWLLLLSACEAISARGDTRHNGGRRLIHYEIGLATALGIATFIALLVALALLLTAVTSRSAVSFAAYAALLVCLLPTTCAALLPALGFAATERAIRDNLQALNGKAAMVAGYIDTVFLHRGPGHGSAGGRLAPDAVIQPDLSMHIDRLAKLGVNTLLVSDAAVSTQGNAAACAPRTAMLQLLQQRQAQGHLVAMVGYAAEDAMALAQADLGVAAQRGSRAARAAANMIDLESDPDRLCAVIAKARQLRRCCTAVTALAIACDLAKFIVVLAAFLPAGTALPPALALWQVGNAGATVLAVLGGNLLLLPVLMLVALYAVRSPPPGSPLAGQASWQFYALGGVALTLITTHLLGGFLHVVI